MKLLVLLAVCALATRAYADGGDRWNAGTMAVQAGGGAIGVVVGVAVVGSIGLAIGYKVDAHDVSWASLAGAVAGAAIGGVVGLVLGVDLAGNERGSTGHWWGTTLGLAGGTLAVAGLAYLQPRSDKLRFALLVTEVTLLLVTPIIGYQLSADAHAPVAPIALITF